MYQTPCRSDLDRHWDRSAILDDFPDAERHRLGAPRRATTARNLRAEHLCNLHRDTPGSAKHLVADLGPCQIRSDRFDNAREIITEAPRKPSTRDHLPFTAANFPVHWMSRRCSNAKADLTVPRLGERNSSRRISSGPP
jgi:hypothetical protein